MNGTEWSTAKWVLLNKTNDKLCYTSPSASPSERGLKSRRQCGWKMNCSLSPLSSLLSPVSPLLCSFFSVLSRLSTTYSPRLPPSLTGRGWGRCAAKFIVQPDSLDQAISLSLKSQSWEWSILELSGAKFFEPIILNGSLRIHWQRISKSYPV